MNRSFISTDLSLFRSPLPKIVKEAVNSYGTIQKCDIDVVINK
jgi:hypothetical protein